MEEIIYVPRRTYSVDSKPSQAQSLAGLHRPPNLFFYLRFCGYMIDLIRLNNNGNLLYMKGRHKNSIVNKIFDFVKEKKPCYR